MNKKILIIIILIMMMQLFSQLTMAQNLQNPELVVESGHTDPIHAIDFSPNGEILASGGRDGMIKLWNTNTGQEIKTLLNGSVDLMQFSADGKFLASLSKVAKTVNIWNIENGKIINTFNYGMGSDPGFGFVSRVDSFIYTSDNKVLVGLYESQNIELWDLSGNRKPSLLKGHSGLVKSLSFIKGGKVLVSSDDKNVVKFWDTSSGKELESLTNIGAKIVFSPNEEFFATTSNIPEINTNGNYSYSIRVWDMKSKVEIVQLQRLTYPPTFSFSPSGNTLIIGDGKKIYFFNIESKILTEQINEVYDEKVNYTLYKMAPKENILATYACCDNSNNNLFGQSIILWDVSSRKAIRTLVGTSKNIKYLEVDETSNILHLRSRDTTIIWDMNSGKNLFEFNHQLSNSFLLKEGKVVIFEPILNKRNMYDLSSIIYDIKLVDYNKKKELKKLEGLKYPVNLVYSPIDDMLAISFDRGKILLLDTLKWKVLSIINAHEDLSDIEFSKDGKTIISSGNDGIKFWNILTGKLLQKVFKDKNKLFRYSSLTLSNDGKLLASGTILNTLNNTINIWNVESHQIIRSFKIELQTNYYYTFFPIGISPDGKILASFIEGGGLINKRIQFWEIKTGKEITYEDFPDWIRKNGFITISKILSKMVKIIYGNNQIRVLDASTEQELIKLILLDKDEWVVTISEGRFDTNKPLDQIAGLHWLVSEQPLKPLPLDIFMRQYYEPGLLQRVLKCNEENNCDKEFKPLPSIAEINRVQPKVLFKDVKASKNAKDSVDVTVEVESVSEDVSVSADDRSKKKRETSGVFDLRLFRDGQLVGVSTPKEKLEPFIKDAPNLIKLNKEEFKKTGKLTDTPEDKAWREANRLIGVKAKEKTKTYTFKNIKLPKNGDKSEVEFTAYAFNEDKVKSRTTKPFKFSLPKEFAEKPKKGRAVLVSIGVNKSETPNYNLRYAANDARKMQEIIGGKLDKEEGKKYSEFIGIELISDDKTGNNPKVNTAQKEIIKGVFSLMSGKSYDEVLAEIKRNGADLAKEFESIPNIKKLKQIEPEDTLIISFSGHGVADNSGIFYLLPYDIGKNVGKINTEVLSKTISSDELSLWMQNITATEMIMIIDACYSSSAVGADFKPGPMGSRGLGQLAYDKDMKLLSATQANNVALELNTLEMGLLSYALLQDGINKKFADTNENKELLSTELLEYAEKRVPELYQEVKDGKRGAVINGKKFKPKEKGVETFYNPNTQKNKSNVNLQQPKAFDFKRRKRINILFNLP